MLLAPGEDAVFASRSPGVSWALAVDQSLLARVLREVHDTSLEAGFSTGRTRCWTSDGLDALVQRVLAGTALHRSPAALEATVTRAVAAHLAGTHTPLVLGAAYRLARRARGLLLDTVDEGISLPALARMLGVGQRTVFAAFAEAYGLSPMAFQRAARLDRVRRRLRRAPPRATVSTVALDAGVEHLGRFAGAYRRQFGELPSETLRRARH